MKSGFPSQSIQHGLAATLWKYEIIVQECKNLAIPFNEIQTLLINKVSIIKNLANELNLEIRFEIIVHAHEMNIPELTLSQKNISFVASINAEVSFDIYSYSNQI